LLHRSDLCRFVAHFLDERLEFALFQSRDQRRVIRRDSQIVDRNWQRLVRPCLATPIKGGSVCQSHGGRLVQVKAAAERVIAQASEIVALRLVGLTAAQDENKVFIDHKVRLGAANSVLDRAGVKGGVAAEENSIPGYRKVLDALFADDSAEEGDE
jgi:hypothetical protein